VVVVVVHGSPCIHVHANGHGHERELGAKRRTTSARSYAPGLILVLCDLRGGRGRVSVVDVVVLDCEAAADGFGVWNCDCDCAEEVVSAVFSLPVRALHMKSECRTTDCRWAQDLEWASGPAHTSWQRLAKEMYRLIQHFCIK